MEHWCIIGLFYDVDTNRLVTFSGLRYLADQDEELKRLYKFDPVYSSIYHGKRYDFADYFDKRKTTNLRRFEYCPDCGKKIDWKGMKKIANGGGT